FRATDFLSHIMKSIRPTKLVVGAATYGFRLFLLFSIPESSRKCASTEGTVVDSQIGISTRLSLAFQEILCITLVEHPSVPNKVQFCPNDHLAIDRSRQVVTTVHLFLAIEKNRRILARTRRGLIAGGYFSHSVQNTSEH